MAFGTQLGMANGRGNGPSPVMKITKCQNTVDRKIPLWQKNTPAAWTRVANVIQSHSDEQQEWEISRIWECSRAVLLLCWEELGGNQLAPCSSALLIDGQFYWQPFPRIPTQPARLPTEATSSSGLCWPGQLSSREQGEEDQSTWRKEESG